MRAQRSNSGERGSPATPGSPRRFTPPDDGFRVNAACSALEGKAHEAPFRFLIFIRIRDGSVRAIHALRHDADGGRSGRRRAFDLSSVRRQQLSFADRLVRDRLRLPLLVHVQARLAPARRGDRGPQGANRARPRRRDGDAAEGGRGRGRAREDVGRGARESAEPRPGRSRRRRGRRAGQAKSPGGRTRRQARRGRAPDRGDARRGDDQCRRDRARRRRRDRRASGGTTCRSGGGRRRGQSVKSQSGAA